jgi:Mn-dependent DtxR family transcriptional regulator
VQEKDTVLREAGEDYLEAILKLEDTEQNVRSIDVAAELGVSRPSVNKALGVLKKAGMVDQQPYGRISLTSLGREKAHSVTARHEILRSFLVDVLGVDPVTADADACRMEHVVSEETMEKLVGHFGREVGK